MACTGAYAFRSWKLLLKEATEMIQRGMVQKGEFYTSGCIQSLILKSETFKILHVDVSRLLLSGKHPYKFDISAQIGMKKGLVRAFVSIWT